MPAQKAGLLYRTFIIRGKLPPAEVFCRRLAERRYLWAARTQTARRQKSDWDSKLSARWHHHATITPRRIGEACQQKGGSGEIYYRRYITNNIDSTLVRRGRGTGPAKGSTIIGKDIGLAAYRLRAVGVLAAV